MRWGGFCNISEWFTDSKSFYHVYWVNLIQSTKWQVRSRLFCESFWMIHLKEQGYQCHFSMNQKLQPTLSQPFIFACWKPWKMLFKQDHIRLNWVWTGTKLSTLDLNNYRPLKFFTFLLTHYTCIKVWCDALCCCGDI